MHFVQPMCNVHFGQPKIFLWHRHLGLIFKTTIKFFANFACVRLNSCHRVLLENKKIDRSDANWIECKKKIPPFIYQYFNR